MSRGLFVMNKKVTSLSWVAPCSISIPSGKHTKLPGCAAWPEPGTEIYLLARKLKKLSYAKHGQFTPIGN
jgi:hypothetical protein